MDLASLQGHMENFYLCSHLPIRAFNKEGVELLSTGFSADYLQLNHKLSTYLTSIDFSSLTKEPLTFTPEAHVQFTLCPISPSAIQNGIYVIGPYTTSLNLKEKLLFKPGHCIPHLVSLLYTLVPSTYSLTSQTSSKETVSEDYSYHISKAEDYIRAHYEEPITLEALAQYLGLNKSYFCTIFKKATKDSFCNYTNKVRVEESKKLLKNTNDSMVDIALAVGFSSSSYFNTIFKKLEGKTPLEYRKNA